MPSLPHLPFEKLPTHNVSGQDNLKLFERMVQHDGLSASSFFSASGIAAIAEKNEGICAFRLGPEIAVYQSRNSILVDADQQLEPSLGPNKSMFGNFMGTQSVADTVRKKKRRAIEQVVGTPRFLRELTGDVSSLADKALSELAGRRLPIKDAALRIVAEVVGGLPGLLDFTTLSLPSILDNAQYGSSAKGFFESASLVIASDRKHQDFDVAALGEFLQFALLANLGSITIARDTNLILRFFEHIQRPISREAIVKLNTSEVAELVTTVLASFDTTALTLVWLLAYLANAREMYKQLICIANSTMADADRLREISLFVLEAVRLGGSNPTSLWRRTAAPLTLSVGGRTYVIPKGIQIWLDRYAANRDARIFPEPYQFNPANIRAIRGDPLETQFATISRARHEINSFSMVNTRRNERKCPGRVFSIDLVARVTDHMLRTSVVQLEGGNLNLKLHSAMPQPVDPGFITIMVKQHSAFSTNREG